jgi:hypothetical protein
MPDDIDQALERLAAMAPERRDELGPVVTTMANVAPERVSWLWDGRLPRGKLVVLDGDPGLGKSTLLLNWPRRSPPPARSLTASGSRRPRTFYCSRRRTG